MQCVLLLALFLQDPQDPPQSRPDAEAPASQPAPKPARRLSDKEAADLTSHFRAKFKKKPPLGLTEKLREVEHLATVSHDKVVALVEQVLKDEPSAAVKKEAVKALQFQPVKATRRAVLAALVDPKHADVAEVAEMLVKALDRNGWEKGDAQLLEKFFPDAEPIVQQAVVRLIAGHGDKAGAKILVDLLDEPAPKDPNAANNPPPSYWEKRWKAWRTCRDEVRTTLEKWTGQKFTTGDEARAWLAKNGAGAGITRW